MERIRVSRSSTLRMYRTQVGSEITAERIGIRVENLSRVRAMQTAWHALMAGLAAAGNSPEAQLRTPPSWVNQVRSAGLVYFDSMRQERHCIWMVNSDHHLTVQHPLHPEVSLSVDIDSADYEDLHVTFYRPYRLRNGEVIVAGDTVLDAGGEEARDVPPEWVGAPYDESAHGKVRRTPQPTLLSLSPQP